MSSVVISGDTSGSVTLSSPAVAGTVTVTLPSTSGTMATLTTPSFATTIGVGGATASASGSGITFPATQSASSDANTLDDYEEGTWTPAFTFSTSGSVTYTAQAGYYRKVGSLVFVESNIFIASVSSPTGNVSINNLPFTVANQSENIGSMTLGIVRNLVNAQPNLRVYCSDNSTLVNFPVNDTMSGFSSLQGADLKASTLIYFSGCFIAN